LLGTSPTRSEQRLLIAKRNFEIARALKQFDLVVVVIIDDDYDAQRDREQMEVSFTLLAAQNERRSIPTPDAS
jgi:hypothetical protein